MRCLRMARKKAETVALDESLAAAHKPVSKTWPSTAMNDPKTKDLPNSDLIDRIDEDKVEKQGE